MVTFPERLYKFGRTNSEDILERFDSKVHYLRKWRNTPLSQDYDVKALWSAWVSKEEAKEAEQWFESNFPKTFITEVRYNGIKECRDWKPNQSYKFYALLEERYPKNAEYWQKVKKLTEEGALKKTHDKIYFVMLTKKTNR